MYADTPRSYVGNVWERHLYGDQPLGWDVIGRRRPFARRRATRSSATWPAGTSRSGP